MTYPEEISKQIVTLDKKSAKLAAKKPKSVSVNKDEASFIEKVEMPYRRVRNDLLINQDKLTNQKETSYLLHDLITFSVELNLLLNNLKKK